MTTITKYLFVAAGLIALAGFFSPLATDEIWGKGSAQIQFSPSQLLFGIEDINEVVLPDSAGFMNMDEEPDLRKRLAADFEKKLATVDYIAAASFLTPALLYLFYGWLTVGQGRATRLKTFFVLLASVVCLLASFLLLAMFSSIDTTAVSGTEIYTKIDVDRANLGPEIGTYMLCVSTVMGTLATLLGFFIRKQTGGAPGTQRQSDLPAGD